MSKNEALPILVTPVGRAAYAWLHKRDTKFAKGNDQGKFKVSVVVPKGEVPEGRLNYGKDVVSGADWMKYVTNLCKQNGIPHTPGQRGCPIKDGDSMKEDFHGCWVIPAHTTFEPKLVDSKGRPLPSNVSIYSGDIVKCSVRPRANTENGFLTLYLDTVMLVEKVVEGGTGIDMGFEDGYEGGGSGDEPVTDMGYDTDDADDDEDF